MKTITIRPMFHRNQEQLAIHFEHDDSLNTLIRQVPYVRWSKTNRCWYLPFDKEHLARLTLHCKDKAIIDYAELKPHLEHRKTVLELKTGGGDLPRYTEVTQKTYDLSPENMEALRKTINYMHMRGLSQSTIRTYRNEFRIFLSHLGPKAAESVTPEDIQEYMLLCIHRLRVSEATINSRINALKLYYEQVLHRDKIFLDIPRPKKAKMLPNVLSERELGRLFQAIKNKKHKAILFIAYSAGLRVSEVVHLKLMDIDSDRMRIHIVQSKGKKDRYVMLSPVVLDMLKNYLAEVQPKPSIYLFESSTPGMPYSARSAQTIFHRAKEDAGIKKDVSFHALRHSFATHLIEKGISIRYVQELLGHFSIKTTERYLHVANYELVEVRSPIDDLFQRGGLEW
jgi:site-specific recombinase XerD